MGYRSIRKQMNELPPAQKLDRQITLQVATLTQGPKYGQVIETWVDYATVWAYVVPWQGREFNAAGQITAEITTRFFIRHLAGVNPKMRISYDGAYYDIHRMEPLGREDGINLFAKARVE